MYLYTQIRDRYDAHRTNRNAQQRSKLLDPAFQGVIVDEVLAKLEDLSLNPAFKDWRHCLVFWARPPQSVRTLVTDIQRRLRMVAPNLWMMPPSNLHMLVHDAHQISLEPCRKPNGRS